MVGRRARPLPAAYVLMYHSERHITVDRSYLHRSLERRCYPKRLADMEEARREEMALLEARQYEAKQQEAGATESRRGEGGSSDGKREQACPTTLVQEQRGREHVHARMGTYAYALHMHTSR